ncbi:MAG TPA: hypothetical protein VMI32_05170 [Candidatus Solibacter sp.]|nr:hypothetical protein [Candidatus Solibacter sp.]
MATKKELAAKKAAKKAEGQRRRDNGLCLHSSCHKKATGGHMTCTEHTKYYRERNRKYAARVKKGLAGK